MICLARYTLAIWTGELTDLDRRILWDSVSKNPPSWGLVDKEKMFPAGHLDGHFMDPEDPDPRLVIMKDGSPEFGGCPHRFEVNMDEVLGVLRDDPYLVADWCGDLEMFFPAGSPDSGAYDRGVAIGLSAWSPSKEVETILDYEIEAVGLEALEDSWADIIPALIKIHEEDFRERGETPINDPRRWGWSHLGFVHFDGIMVLDGEMQGDSGGWWGEPDFWAVFDFVGVMGSTVTVTDNQVVIDLVKPGPVTGPDLVTGTPVITEDPPRRSILDLKVTEGHAGPELEDPDMDPEDPDPMTDADILFGSDPDTFLDPFGSE